MKLVTCLAPVLGVLLTLGSVQGPATARDRAARTAPPLRARYVVTVADDFIVDVYHNGRAVPDTKRTLLEERFGATAERLDIEVRKGDWLVFNVVNNRIRWGGAYYFAAAGCFAANEFGFQSDLTSGQWSACDSPREADRFIGQREYLRHRAARAVSRPWTDGTGMMHAYAGSGWSGAPVWGAQRNTWIKVVVE